MKSSSFEQALAQSLQAKDAPHALKQRLAHIPEQFPQVTHSPKKSHHFSWWIPSLATAASLLGFTLGFQDLLFPNTLEDSQIMITWLYGSVELGGLSL